MRQRWEVDELIESWTLDPDDVGLVANKTGSTRLGFAFGALEGGGVVERRAWSDGLQESLLVDTDARLWFKGWWLVDGACRGGGVS
jgi:hypothetical protein